MSYPLINSTSINGAAGAGEGPTTQGFMRTRYGTPSVSSVITTVLQVSSLVRSTRFGAPTMAHQVVTPGLTSVGIPTLGAVARFGVPAVRPSLAVQVAAFVPSTAFGTPNAGVGHSAAGFRHTAFGVPNAQFVVRGLGFSSTRFGIPNAQRIARAGSLPGLRFGVPRIVGSTGVGAEGFSSTAFGMPSMHRAARALPGVFSARFGRPTIVRNSQC